MEKILQMQRIKYKYQTPTDEVLAVDNFNLSVKKGEFVSIIGPSGCGKTTILSLISGLITPTEGKIYTTSKNLNLGYMLQKDQLFPWRTIEKNIYLPLEIKKNFTKENKQYAEELLKKYGLYDFRKNYPSELSGGMRQRVALIRTLVFKPEILLLDEPFSALDSQTRLEVCDDVYKIIKNENKTTILVTHDISEAISLSDRIIVLTKRPATVKSEFIPKIQGSSPLERREKPEFSILFEKIYKELRS